MGLQLILIFLCYHFVHPPPPSSSFFFFRLSRIVVVFIYRNTGKFILLKLPLTLYLIGIVKLKSKKPAIRPKTLYSSFLLLLRPSLVPFGNNYVLQVIRYFIKPLCLFTLLHSAAEEQLLLRD